MSQRSLVGRSTREKIDHLVSLLPAEMVHLGNSRDGSPIEQPAELSLYYDANARTWEIEWIPLDGSRNYANADDDLDTLLDRTLAYVDTLGQKNEPKGAA